MSLYLAVGHGRRPDGTYDPGATNPEDGAVEHLQAFHVVEAATRWLREAGVEVTSESDQGWENDPDYIGSTKAVNDGAYKAGVEVHFDWWEGVHGESGLYVSPAGQLICEHVSAAFRAYGFPDKPDVHRTDLYFLNATRVPAVIIEVDKIYRLSDVALHHRGRALALGLLHWLDHPVPPALVPVPAQYHVTDQNTGAHLGAFDSADVALETAKRVLVGQEHDTPTVQVSLRPTPPEDPQAAGADPNPAA